MRAWYDDIDTATLQRIKTYSAFNDPESKNLMVQTMYEYKQEEIAELEAQIEKMKCCYNCSKWYDGECEESPKSKTFFCADFKCDNWEIADD